MTLSHPHMGDYYIPIKTFLEEVFPGAVVQSPPKPTVTTIELGAKHSPDFVCAPFKHNLGNFIEALDGGADVLLQTGKGCLYGYYAEVQEEILRSLGYDFKFIRLTRENARPRRAYEIFKDLDPTVTVQRLVSALMRGIVKIYLMDKIAFYQRVHCVTGVYEDFLGEISGSISLPRILRLGLKYKRRLRKPPDEKPRIRVGIIGELFTLMDSHSNHNVEERLRSLGVSVHRKMSVTFLLFGKNDKRTLKKTDGYLRYTVGANGVDSVAQMLLYAKSGFDGIIHMKSSGCIPEINAEPVLQKISGDYDIPLLRLSFDSQTAETGLDTRIEAFVDMLEMKREKDGVNFRRGRRLDIDQGGRA